MARYRAGIIGLGRIGSTMDDHFRNHPFIALPYSHMACLRELSDVEVVAAADPYAEQRDAFSTRWEIANVYSDFRDMLDSERLDIVTVATGTGPRHKVVMNCLKSGVKAIYAEKPLAITLAEADEMVADARAKGVVFAVGCTRRSDPWWREVRNVIARGQIGTVLHVNAFGECGISLNGSHMIDLIRFLVDDDVAWVFGESESDEAAQSNDDHRINGYLAFKGGARAFVRTWTSGALDWSFDIVGDAGAIRATGNGSRFEWITTSQPGVLTSRSLPRPQRFNSPGVNAFRDMIACIETGRKPACSGDDGLAALETAIALRESHRAGCVPIRLPLEDRSLGIRSMDAMRGDLPAALQRRDDA